MTSRSSAPRRPRLLVFSRTAAFRHSSIPHAIAAVREMTTEGRFDVDATEDPTVFTPANLRRYAAMMFLLTSGDVLDGEQQRAFEEFIRAGGGFAGVHSASDTEYDWPFYGGLLGAYFATHPPAAPATVVVEDPAHASTDGVPPRWTRTDEWYDFRTNPRPHVRVLLRVDEATYAGGGMGGDHPISWYHSYAGGRSWYTALGHTDDGYRDPVMRRHLLGGIRYALGEAPDRG